MIERLLPPDVLAVDSDTRLPEIELFPEELRVLRSARPRRRRDFERVRACAREALSRAGLPAVPILPDGAGAPQWPSGIVGSMTHAAGYEASAVATAARVRAIGIDGEPAEPLPSGVWDIVATREEKASIPTHRFGQPPWQRLVFSAKESVYKAWYPVHRTWLDFADIEIRPERDGTFRAAVRQAEALGDADWGSVHGRWLTERGLLVTAVVIPRPAAVDPGVSATGSVQCPHPLGQGHTARRRSSTAQR